MPLNLNVNLKNRLKQLLPNSLKALKVKNKRYLDDMSRFLAFFPVEEALPKNGKFAEEIDKFVGEFPVGVIAADCISKDLEERYKYEAGEQLEPLLDLDTYSDPNCVADWLIEELDALPHKYRISMKIPDALSNRLTFISDVFPIGDGINIINGTSSFLKSFPLNSQNEARQKRIFPALSLLDFGKTSEKTWVDKYLYLQIEANGYIDRYGTTSPFRDAEAFIKSFFGFFLIYGLLETKYKSPSFADNAQFYVHRKENKSWNIDGCVSASDRLVRTLFELEHVKFKEEYENDDFVKRHLTHCLNEFSTICKTREKNERLLLAAQWFLEGYARQDEVMSFLQTVVVLEVLLGEKSEADNASLGALLKSRCAYLIAKSPDERISIQKDIGLIYKLRSNIIHIGKHRLSFEERVLFTKLRSICTRVYKKEVELITG